MALLDFSNLASIMGNRGKATGGGSGLQVTNTPGYTVPLSNQLDLTGDLAGIGKDTRTNYYQAGDFSNLPNLMSNTGLNLGTVTADYNTQMETNVNPVDAAMKVYGFTPQQVYQYLTAPGNQGNIAAVANQLGIDATALTNWVNNYAGTTFTPEQGQSYLTQGPTTTSNLMDLIAGAKGPSSSSSGGGGSSSFSGMDWSKSPVSFNQLQGLAANLPNLASEYNKTLYNRYSKLMQDTLGDKGTYAGVLNEMGGRNMLGSSVAGDALNNVALGVARDIGDKAYASDIAGLNAQMTVPKTLADIAQLGQISTGQSSNFSSSVTNPGTLANLQTLVEMLSGSMFQ